MSLYRLRTLEHLKVLTGFSEETEKRREYSRSVLQEMKITNTAGPRDKRSQCRQNHSLWLHASWEIRRAPRHPTLTNKKSIERASEPVRVGEEREGKGRNAPAHPRGQGGGTLGTLRSSSVARPSTHPRSLTASGWVNMVENGRGGGHISYSGRRRYAGKAVSA